MERGRPRILIAGLGNELLQDDGIGVHAARELKNAGQAGVRVAEVGTAVLDALDLFEWADKILAIDAMQAGHPPGTIYVFGVSDVEKSGRQTSLHELSLVDALSLLRPGKANPDITILGVEPKTIDWGLELTPILQGVLPQLIAIVNLVIASWREGNSTPRLETLFQDTMQNFDNGLRRRAKECPP